VRGDRSDDYIEDHVKQTGARIFPLTVYRNRYAEWDPLMVNKICENPPDYIVFTSGSTVEGFVHILGDSEAIRVAHLSKIVVIGPSTAAVAVELGLKVDIQAGRHNVDGVVEAMTQRGVNAVR